MRTTWGLLATVGLAIGQPIDVWDLPPLRYSETPATDPIATLAKEIESTPELLDGKDPLARLRFVLDRLDVPESSQVLVFSKTSKQIRKIDPATPRAVYFSESHYVGFVPGGAIEVIAQDPVLGPVFYLIGGGGAPDIQRDRSECFSCHGTTRTEEVPGMLVRSVFPDADGRPLLAKGSVTVDHTTPIDDRWGGYYVTGHSAIDHRGNRIYREEDEGAEELSLEKVDLSRYPRGTSDIVALMVLEHQCRVHNLLTAASIRYRRAEWLARVIDPEADPDEGQAGRIADGLADEIVEALLFRDEASLGEGIEGDRGYQKDYADRFPRSADGRSLADFRLYERIFKHRCSCMIYSSAFQALPPRIHAAVLGKLKVALESGEGVADHLGASERRKILTILDDTLPDWREKGW